MLPLEKFKNLSMETINGIDNGIGEAQGKVIVRAPANNPKGSNYLHEEGK